MHILGSDYDVFVSDHYFTYHRFFIPGVDGSNEIFFWDGHCHPPGVSFTLWVVFNYDIVVLKCRFVFVFCVESAVVYNKDVVCTFFTIYSIYKLCQSREVTIAIDGGASDVIHSC